MKAAFCALLVICLSLAVVNSISFSSQHRNLSHKKYYSLHKGISYYGRHYLSHKSEEYVKKVRDENKQRIEEFNANNKEALKAGQKGDQFKTGGNSFAMGKTKFLQFTSEEFVHLFTGLKRTPSHEHLKREETVAQTHQTFQSQSHKIFTNHFLLRIDPILSHNEEVHKQDDDQNEDPQDNADQNDEQDDDWQFEDPYAIGDGELTDLYGDVNNDDNYGWDWKSLDKDYYDEDEDLNDDEEDDDYWKKWQDDHWGDDDEDGVVEQDGEDSPWYKDWEENAEKNQDNEEWWEDDGWDYEDEEGNADEGDEDADNGDDTADDTADEQSDGHKTIYLRSNHNLKAKANKNQEIQPYSKNATEVNWVKKGATTHIKQQGECGSCWTYSAVAVVESYLLIKGKGTTDLSEQQLVDCQKKQSYGCDGGQESMGLEWAVNSGLVAQSKYPYRGINQKCYFKTGPHKIPKYFRASGRSKIQEALRKGPVTAAVYVDEGFQFYKKGIFDKCAKGQPNHAVVLVGFTKDYWIIRNSWGEDWGEQGHMRIKKNQNKNNACSIENDAYGVGK